MPSRRHRWLGRVLALLLVLALGGGAWFLVQQSRGSSASSMTPGSFWRGGGGPAATVGMASAELGEMPVFVEALGTATPVAEVQLRPQVGGTLLEVLFEEGQAVKQGDLLARIDPRPFEQALAQAQGTRSQNEAQLANAKVTLARFETLWKQDSIARQDLDAQRALVAQLEGTVRSNRAAEEQARIDLGYTRILSPISGRIGLRAVDAGNMVSAGQSPGVATVTQMAPMDVQFALPQAQIAAVAAAQGDGPLSVAALDSARSQTLATGQFLTLDNAIDPATGSVQAKARFDNDDGVLFPSQFVNVRLKLGVQHGVLIPVTAVRTGPDGDYVYVVDAENTARRRPVEQGRSEGGQVLVLSGLEAGERVVSEGGDRVSDGGTVKAAGADEEAAAGGRRGPAGQSRPAP